ncbi:hypothetical protein ACKKBF_B00710 [Auxenochlorella protothecoides x Auxenochlorella symbiontica]
MAESVSQALLVVDMQNDFLLPSSPVCVAGGMDAVPAVMQAVQFARENGVPVIWVLRAHHHLGLSKEYWTGVMTGSGQGWQCMRVCLVTWFKLLSTPRTNPLPSRRGRGDLKKGPLQ